MSRCTCEKYDLGDGVLRREWPAPACPSHGQPDADRWYAGDPLIRHRWVIDRATGEALPQHEARSQFAPNDQGAIDGWEWMRRFRDETPSETLNRLLAERRVPVKKAQR